MRIVFNVLTRSNGPAYCLLLYPRHNSAVNMLHLAVRAVA